MSSFLNNEIYERTCAFLYVLQQEKRQTLGLNNMRKQVFIEQRTPEWFAWRKNKIGASDVPVIMRESPFKTPLMLWEEKCMDVERKLTKSMEKGIHYEDEAREAACVKLGVKFKPACFEHVSNPYMIASLDGWCEDNGALEIKVPREEDHLAALGKVVPSHYMPQLQAIMLVTNMNHMWYCSYNPERKQLANILVKKDNGYCDQILEASESFYKSMIDLEPPEAIDKDYVKVDDIEGLAKMYLDIDNQYQEAKNKKEELRDAILKLAGNRNATFGNLKVTKFIEQGRIDYAKIPELRNVNLDLYRKKPIEKFRIS